MSVTFCTVSLLLLCLSSYACNARPLPTADKQPEKESHVSSQIDAHRKNILATPEAESSAVKGLGAGKVESTQETEHKDHHPRNGTDLKGGEQRIMTDDRKAQNAQGESLVAVSWRVPQRKRREKHPGFNLDYSPPKTHPPSHN